MMNACGRLDIGSKIRGDLRSEEEEIDYRAHKLARAMGSSNSCIQSKDNPFKNVGWENLRTPHHTDPGNVMQS